jgi:hypothetical protein
VPDVYAFVSESNAGCRIFPTGLPDLDGIANPFLH